MDDPTLRCENDAGNETRFRGFPFPSGDPYFFLRRKFRSLARLLHVDRYAVTHITDRFAVRVLTDRSA